MSSTRHVSTVDGGNVAICSNHYWSRVHTIQFSSMVAFISHEIDALQDLVSSLPSQLIVLTALSIWCDYVSGIEGF